MPAKNKLRGTYYERRCVEKAQGYDLKAETRGKEAVMEDDDLPF